MLETTSAAVSEPDLTHEHLARADSYLCATRDALLASTTDLSPEQWNFKPAPDRWSIAEIVEHIGLAEHRVHGIIEKMRDAPRCQDGGWQARMDEVILTEVPKRSSRVEAPEWMRPTDGHKDARVIEHFLQGRKRTIELLSASPLRGHVIPHPILGPWDGYQWLLAAGAHSARHTDQIREVKADPRFPRRPGEPGA
jgi:DinB superfamily